MLSHLQSALHRCHIFMQSNSLSDSIVAAMAVTTFPSEGSPDLALLNVARLFTRLEHNLLSPGTDRRSFQQSEYQRMRVNKVSISQPWKLFFQRTYLQGTSTSEPQV
jgi:hypothetical protein